MSDYYLNLVDHYRQRGVIVDTNLLVLYIVGLVDRKYIREFKETKTFAIEDFGTVTDLLNQFQHFYTTPNILTEANSQLNHLSSGLKPMHYTVFKALLTKFQENCVPAVDIALMNEFKIFGLTDAGIMRLAQQGPYLVLTADGKLATHLERQGVDVLNFNHIRTINWKE